ncbi:hypothetical protein K458DRAFT_422050 [Lentithecium fluviatile CBS 122367]|uniref:Uncharacterized protein n=1 Tax=Lentithecium fluviatile CBS 122367 TaxID=1168545 RepID=A0A6G1IPD8_9PLEO|nr:hypothetical protein K458DRAFT_422050 [Lentithecium fluviatile CBS 122367]
MKSAVDGGWGFSLHHSPISFDCPYLHKWATKYSICQALTTHATLPSLPDRDIPLNHHHARSHFTPTGATCPTSSNISPNILHPDPSPGASMQLCQNAADFLHRCLTHSETEYGMTAAQIKIMLTTELAARRCADNAGKEKEPTAHMLDATALELRILTLAIFISRFPHIMSDNVKELSKHLPSSWASWGRFLAIRAPIVGYAGPTYRSVVGRVRVGRSHGGFGDLGSDFYG